jgi:hypothetical protein
LYSVFIIRLGLKRARKTIEVESGKRVKIFASNYINVLTSYIPFENSGVKREMQYKSVLEVYTKVTPFIPNTQMYAQVEQIIEQNDAARGSEHQYIYPNKKDFTLPVVIGNPGKGKTTFCLQFPLHSSQQFRAKYNIVHLFSSLSNGDGDTIMTLSEKDVMASDIVCLLVMNKVACPDESFSNFLQRRNQLLDITHTPELLFDFLLSEHIRDDSKPTLFLLQLDEFHVIHQSSSTKEENVLRKILLAAMSIAMKKGCQRWMFSIILSGFMDIYHYNIIPSTDYPVKSFIPTSLEFNHFLQILKYQQFDIQDEYNIDQFKRLFKTIEGIPRAVEVLLHVLNAQEQLQSELNANRFTFTAKLFEDLKVALREKYNIKFNIPKEQSTEALLNFLMLSLMKIPFTKDSVLSRKPKVVSVVDFDDTDVFFLDQFNDGQFIATVPFIFYDILIDSTRMSDLKLSMDKVLDPTAFERFSIAYIYHCARALTTLRYPYNCTLGELFQRVTDLPKAVASIQFNSSLFYETNNMVFQAENDNCFMDNQQKPQSEIRVSTIASSCNWLTTHCFALWVGRNCTYFDSMLVLIHSTPWYAPHLLAIRNKSTQKSATTFGYSDYVMELQAAGKLKKQFSEVQEAENLDITFVYFTWKKLAKPQVNNANELVNHYPKDCKQRDTCEKSISAMMNRDTSIVICGQNIDEYLGLPIRYVVLRDVKEEE